MAQAPAVSNATKGIGSSFKNLPKPVLIGVPLAAAGAFYLWQKKKAAAAAANSTTTSGTTSSSDTGTTADQNQGNWSSGGAFGGGYGNPNPLQQFLQNNPSTPNTNISPVNPTVTPTIPTVTPAVTPAATPAVTSPAGSSNNGATTLGGVTITPPSSLKPTNVGSNPTATSSYINPIVNSDAQEGAFINQENQIIANEQAVTAALTPGSSTFNPSAVMLQPGTTGIVTVPATSALPANSAPITTTSPTVSPAGTIALGGKGARVS
jgi:hypothetical protein